MKHNKATVTLLFLLLFTKSQHEKNAGTRKGEEQRVLGKLYHNIYQILKRKIPSKTYIYIKYIYLPFN